MITLKANIMSLGEHFASQPDEFHANVDNQPSCLVKALATSIMGLGGVDGNLHFPVPSMNRLNQSIRACNILQFCRVELSQL
jgi:hypothetical protein